MSGFFVKSEVERVLDFIESCDVVRKEQVRKLFPEYEIDLIIGYLLKKKRIHISESEYLHSTQIGRDVKKNLVPDEALSAAIGVLGDLMGKVKYFTKALAPAQIAFQSLSGDMYEIIYVGYGLEVMIGSIYNRIANVAGKTDNSVKRIIIVQDKTQIEKVKGRIPNIMRFALVQQNGTFSYTNA